jgi:hypothetical protein
VTIGPVPTGKKPGPTTQDNMPTPEQEKVRHLDTPLDQH